MQFKKVSIYKIIYIFIILLTPALSFAYDVNEKLDQLRHDDSGFIYGVRVNAYF